MRPQRDRWAEWLLERRHGGDEEQFERMRPALEEFRLRVIANAEIREGDVVLDVGTGDGLIAFAALEEVGAGGRVVFSDVSEDPLAECRRRATELGVVERSDFVRAAADALPFGPDSFDVVTTRSVLIYLLEKEPAFREFHRVLRSGGRLSIFEPINIFGHEQMSKFYYGLDVSPVQHLADKVIARWSEPPEQHPLLNFDERDLFRFAEDTGFEEVRMDYRAETTLEEWTTSWETFRRSSGNPLDPTPEEEIAEALEPAERAEFEAYLRKVIESRPRVRQWRAGAYLRAVKPLR
jgi:arsenite methyltransferase